MKKVKYNYFLSLSLLVLIFGCGNTAQENKNESAKNTDPLTEHIDSTENPANDFFGFANGKWFKENPIPASESSNGIFLIIQDSVNAAVKEICEKSAQANAATKGSNQQKIGDLFFSGMDTATINQAGISVLKTDLDAIESVSDLKSLLKQTAILHQKGVEVLFDFDIRQDEKISSKMIVGLTQGGLGLPERDYYTNADLRTLEIRNAYLVHIEKMFVLSGVTLAEAKQSATTILKIETALANVSRKMEALRDPFKNYNKMTLPVLNKITPSLDWTEIMKDLGLAAVDSVNVGQPEFYKGLDVILKKTSVEDFKIYLKW